MPALAKVLHMSLWRSLRAPPPPPPSGLRLSTVRDALARAEQLIEPPPALPPNVILLRPVPLPPRPELEDAPSPWDPEPETAVILRGRKPENDDDEEPLIRDEALILQEINGSKTLLLEIVRRASYDWVLYRTSRRLAYKLMADQAYAWLFLERPGTKDWNLREREGKWITSFESICEALDLDPDTVRNHVKKLTPRNVMSVGRPPSYRKRDVFSDAHGDDIAHALPSGLVVESNPSDDDTIY
jgi:hypothetical protein